MKRYWIVESNCGETGPVTAFTSLAFAGLECRACDEAFPRHSPHRVVPLIEHTEALETLIREAIANVDSVTSKDLREAILAVEASRG